MDVKNKELQYNIDMVETENIEIKINGNSVFSETVPDGYKCSITFMYQEIKEVI